MYNKLSLDFKNAILAKMSQKRDKFSSLEILKKDCDSLTTGSI